MDLALVKLGAKGHSLGTLGLACLQAYLKSNDVDVRVFNIKSTCHQLGIELPDASNKDFVSVKVILNHQDLPLLLPLVDDILAKRTISLLDGVYPEIINDLSYHLKESHEILLERYKGLLKFVEESIPHFIEAPIIGLSIDYLNIKESVIASAIIKKDFPDKTIIWGGPTITQSIDAFKLFLHRSVCDALVIGEGEKPLLEIAQGKPFGEIDGVMVSDSKSPDGFVCTPSKALILDELPTPDYTGIDLWDNYLYCAVYTSRGCTNRCNFCSEWFLSGRKFRTRSPEKVVEDIENISQKYDAKFIVFGDSLVNHSIEYFEKLCDLIIERDLDIEFMAFFRADSLTKDIAQKAIKAGFTYASIGIEALSEFQLKKMNKAVKSNKNLEAINILSEVDINLSIMLILGFTTPEEEKSNLKYILRLIDTLGEKRVYINGKKEKAAVQWSPMPFALTPGSASYKSSESILHSWKLSNNLKSNNDKIFRIEKELEHIPYSFERQTPDHLVFTMIDQILKLVAQKKFRVKESVAQRIQLISEMRKVIM